MTPVTITSYSTPEEASIVQGMLESHGIQSVIRDRNNLYVPIFGGVDLMVDEADAARARELLKEHDD